MTRVPHIPDAAKAHVVLILERVRGPDGANDGAVHGM